MERDRDDGEGEAGCGPPEFLLTGRKATDVAATSRPYSGRGWRGVTAFVNPFRLVTESSGEPLQFITPLPFGHSPSVNSPPSDILFLPKRLATPEVKGIIGRGQHVKPSATDVIITPVTVIVTIPQAKLRQRGKLTLQVPFVCQNYSLWVCVP
ncbi:hypothetical protein EVAR_41394_1 [Eumeta japonica]|uniref:Uncharacterized protein n=1 Tax=Eumeta variegata TaxID=151549 RepID=A0A4C1WXL5_EUMVA|nr:hypothetical protein EVAR_41394_1 [Eumeta japonica]